MTYESVFSQEFFKNSFYKYANSFLYKFLKCQNQVAKTIFRKIIFLEEYLFRTHFEIGEILLTSSHKTLYFLKSCPILFCLSNYGAKIVTFKVVK